MSMSHKLASVVLASAMKPLKLFTAATALALTIGHVNAKMLYLWDVHESFFAPWVAGLARPHETIQVTGTIKLLM